MSVSRGDGDDVLAFSRQMIGFSSHLCKEFGHLKLGAIAAFLYYFKCQEKIMTNELKILPDVNQTALKALANSMLVPLTQS
jgi:hypothetical protein